MKKTILALSLSAFALAAYAAQERWPTDEEIRANQSLGSVTVSPDGAFILYEWIRPYNWYPETGWLEAPAKTRKQAWMYRVNLTDPEGGPKWGQGGERLKSEELFAADPGSSYYLGSISPDNKMFAYYEIDHDENVVRAGVWRPEDLRLVTFDVPPDETKFDTTVVKWISDDEVAYPSRKGGWVKGKIPGKEEVVPLGQLPPSVLKTEPCANCASLPEKGTPPTRKPVGPASAELGKDVKVLAQSKDGKIKVYGKSDSKVLGLLVQNGADAQPETIFENERVLKPWTPPKAADEKAGEKK